jgi:hypothetical protein
MTIKTKHFTSDTNVPATVPDGTSLEEQVNLFLGTLDPKNIIDVMFAFSQTGKYGSQTTYTATVVYKE